MANKVTINTEALNISWAPNTQYRFEVDENFLVQANDPGVGITQDANFYTFTTNSTGPVLASSIPANGATNVTDNSQVVIIFDRKIVVNTGNIRLYKQDGTLLGTFSVTDNTKVTVGDDRLTVNLFGYLQYANTGYYFTVDAGVVLDYDGFASVAIVSSSAIAYATGGAGVVASTSPAVNSTYVTNGTSLTITFDRQVIANSGNIQLYRVASPDVLVHSFDVTNSSEVTVSGYTVTLNTTNYIKSFQTYYYLIDAGYVKDFGGIPCSAVTSTTAIRYSMSLLLSDTFTLASDPNHAGLAAHPNFGLGLAMTDTYLAIGAPTDSTNATSDDYKGSVTVINPSNGNQLRYIYNSGGGQLSEFGSSLSISGNTLAVGVPEHGNTYIGGQVITYDLTNGNSLRTFLNPNSVGKPWKDYFGNSVSLYNDNLVIGAKGEDGSSSVTAVVLNVDSTGKFYTGTDGSGNDGADWFAPYGSEVWPVTITGTKTGTATIYGYTTGKIYYTSGLEGTYPNWYFKLFEDPASPGTTVTVSAGTLAGLTFTVGIPLRGRAYLYQASTGNLLNTFTNPRSVSSTQVLTGDEFGHATAINSNYIVISSLYNLNDNNYLPPYNNPLWSQDDGARVYVYNASTYSLLYTLSNPSQSGVLAGSSSGFGYSIALYGTKLAVGDQSLNKVFVYDLTTGTLTSTFTGPSAVSGGDNRYGWSVSMNSKYLMVGDPYYDTVSMTNKGRAYVYDINNGTEIMVVENPAAGTGTTNLDNFAWLVGLSESYLAITAPFDNGPPPVTDRLGTVYLYKEKV